MYIRIAMACCSLLRENSAAYVTRAIDNGRHDHNYVVSAARLAQRDLAHILGRSSFIPIA